VGKGENIDKVRKPRYFRQFPKAFEQKEAVQRLNHGLLLPNWSWSRDHCGDGMNQRATGDGELLCLTRSVASPKKFWLNGWSSLGPANQLGKERTIYETVSLSGISINRPKRTKAIQKDATKFISDAILGTTNRPKRRLVTADNYEGLKQLPRKL
jgi:hypothetical protein